MGRDQHAADRESVGHALRRSDEVGTDARRLMGEEPPRAAVSRLDFVQHQLRPGFGGRFAQPAQKFVRGAVDARHALDALDDHRRELPRRKFLPGGFEVVQRRELHVGGAVEGRLNRGVVRYGDGSRRAAVESLRDGQHLAAARVERRQFQGVFIGLGPRVAEEEAVVVVTRDAPEFFGECPLERVLHRVRIEPEACDLLLHGPYVVGLRMPDRDHGVAAVEVEILGARLVVDEAAPAPDGFDRI